MFGSLSAHLVMSPGRTARPPRPRGVTVSRHFTWFHCISDGGRHLRAWAGRAGPERSRPPADAEGHVRDRLSSDPGIGLARALRYGQGHGWGAGRPQGRPPNQGAHGAARGAQRTDNGGGTSFRPRCFASKLHTYPRRPPCRSTRTERCLPCPPPVPTIKRSSMLSRTRRSSIASTSR